VNQDDLAVLACDLAARPAGAPGFGAVAPMLRALRREDGALVAEYEPAAAATLAEVVAAERLCCASIDWRLEGTRLTVRAPAAALDVLAGALGRA